MAQNYRKLVDGLNLVPKASSANSSLGDLEVLSSTNRIMFHNGTTNSSLLTADSTDTLTNKTIAAGSNTITGITNTNLSGTAAVSNANLAAMAAHTFKGNNTGSSSTPLDLTQAQLTAELNLFTTSLQGVVPASGGGTVNFLRADGTFAAPPNPGGTINSIGTIDSQTKSANGLVISGSSLVAQTADATNPGMVSTGAQTIAGLKSFSGGVASNTISDVSGGLTISSSSGQNINISPSATGRLRVNSVKGIDMAQVSSPTAPAAGFDSLYFKSNDLLYSMNSSGVETLIGSGGSSGSLGGVNFITLDNTFQPTATDNSNFETTVGNWVSYNNNSGTIAQSLTSNGAINTVDPNRWYGQKFTTVSAASVASVAFKLSKSGTISGNMIMRIYSDSAGLPGSIIASSNAINANTLTGTLTVTTFTFSSPPALTSATVYHAVLDNSAVSLSPGNGIALDADTTNPYAGGNEVFTLNAGSSWNSGAPNDLYFDIQSTAVPLTLTGGTSTLTVSRTTTSGEVLDGAGSLKVVKGASNSINQGVSCIANIPLGYRGSIASIQFPFKVLSGSLVNGDISLYIYDITNSALITPTNNSLAAGLMKMTFDVPANTTQVRVGLNFDTSSATAVTYSLDDIVVGPQEVIYGPTMTDEVDESTAFNFNNLGVSSKHIFTRQVGNKLSVRGTVVVSSTAGAGAEIVFPSKYVIDSSKQPSGIYAKVGILNRQSGVSGSQATFSQNYGAVVFFDGTNYDRLFIAVTTSSSTSYDKNNSNSFLNSGETIDFQFEVPINGFSTNVVQQNAATFQISNYLAYGTQVSSAPTKLGQYRPFYRATSANNNLTDCITISTPPTVQNGIYIDGSVPGNASGTNNIPQSYDIFIGTNKIFDVQWFASPGRTGSITVGTSQYGGSGDTGAYTSYDPTTGIVQVNASLFYNGAESARSLGTSIGTSVVAVPNGYFEIFVSEKVIPVQMEEEDTSSFPSISDPIAYTPTFVGIGTPTNINVFYNQEGKYLYAKGSFTTGTTTAVPFTMSLPSGLGLDSAVVDPTAEICGEFTAEATSTGGTAQMGLLMIQPSTSNNLIYGGNINVSGSSRNLQTNNASFLFNNTTKYSFSFKVPIGIWSANNIQQSASTFSMSSYLANGTVVTSAPTQLGQYRPQLRVAGTNTYTTTNATPAILPSAIDGILLYNTGAYGSGDSANQPSRYDIFIGKNKIFDPSFFLNSGKTHPIQTDVAWINTNVIIGVIKVYDPNTGILSLTQMTETARASYMGVDNNGDPFPNNAYFDVNVSEKVIPVQISNSSYIRVDTSAGNGSSATCIPRWTNITESFGTAITYTSDAVNGDKFTINEDGTYIMSYSTTGQTPGITLNEVGFGSTNINAVPVINVLNAVNTSLSSSVTASRPLVQGDVIRGHNNGTAGSGSPYAEMFSITKIGN